MLDAPRIPCLRVYRPRRIGDADTRFFLQFMQSPVSQRHRAFFVGIHNGLVAEMA